MAKKKMNLKAPERVAAAKNSSLRNKRGLQPMKATKGPLSSKAGSGLESANASGNMFERLWNRRKFDVLGKKVKGEQQRVGKARSDAVERRKVSLLQEYKQRGNKNTFLDRRFGEQDEGLGEEEKAIMRFQRERQSQLSRRSKFNLEEDEEGEEDILTHGGQPLSAFDDFDKGGGLEEDEYAEDAALGAEMVDHLHFGGGFVPKTRKEEGAEGEDKEEVPKSKKEVMEEIMAKSKYYKAEHQKQKDADEELREKLDKDFRTLTDSSALLTLLRPKKSAALSTRRKESGGDEEGGGADAYESLAKSMVFDLRAHAGEKRKDPEEVAKAERERLMGLEKERQKRMAGGGSSDEEGGDEDGEGGGGGWAGRRRKRQKGMDVSGDDLGDNLMIDEVEAGPGWVDQVMARKEEEEEEEEEEDEEEEEEGEGDGEDDDEEEDGWEQSGSEDEGKGVETKVGVVEKEAKVGVVGGELPFVIEAPQSLAEWRSVVDGRGVEEVSEAITRVRACTAISLHPSNKRKMQLFYATLLQYFSSLAGEVPLPIDRLDALLPPLLDLAATTPLYAALCARERILAMHRQLARKIKEGGGEAGGGSSWPSLRVFLLFRLWSLTFPPSDFRHPVITPLLLVGGEYLATCRVRSLKDAAIGLFLCSLMLVMVREGRRLVPEALSFLQALLDSALPSPPQGGKKQQYMAAQMGGPQWLYPPAESAGGEEGGQVAPLQFEQVMVMESSHAFFQSDACRLSLLSICLHTFLAYVRLYTPLPSFPELFAPSLPTLKSLSEVALPEGVERCREEVWGAISAGVRDSEALRQPLRMRAKQAVARKQFNPIFEENYAKGRDYDPDRERAERKKLQRAVKKEARGAARELRKDNYFLAEERRKEQVEAEGEREEKYKKAMAFLQEQEGAFKSGQLGNSAKKKKRK